MIGSLFALLTPETNLRPSGDREMRAAILVLAITGLGLGVMAGHSQEPKKGLDPKLRPDPETVKALMGKKLDHSQKLLAALVTNKLDEAGKEAENLIKIRKEVAWMIHKTKEYELWSDEFNRSAEKIIKAAKDKNPDAAKLGYLEMTQSCFHCHTYVRDLGDIRALGTSGPE
jgi:hypothetical protein